MKLDILSERAYRTWPSWYVVFEWEDVIANELDCHIVIFGRGMACKIIRKIKKDWSRLNKSANEKYRITNVEDCKLLWIMNAQSYKQFPVKNIIPIFLDFPCDMVDSIIEATKNLPIFFVTCRDIYNMFLAKGIKNVRFMPLSISDIYYSDVVPEKNVDVIQFGRKNSVLHNYMMEYCKKHPKTEYIYQTSDGSLTYVSTIRGGIGKFDTRREYIDLIKSARVSLVSTPGCDKSRPMFGNIDFVTPRFFESAAFYCHMIGRYTENQETDELRLRDVCPNVVSYDEFEKVMNSYLNDEDWNWSIQQEFVRRNLTSVRAKFMKEELERL